MATRNVVNLDALIPREDLSAPAESGGDIPGLKISDLKPGLVYSWLRKPDFQRETANWTPEQVVGLIETFANGNIIPAIILWQNGQRVFVVDGAHRLSALVAWANDDYGAGSISAKHYGNAIPEHQRVMHDLTRKMVKERVRSYADHELAAQYQKADDQELLKRASLIGFKSIDTQWIKNAGVEQAKSAFFRINEGGTPIDATETRILRAGNSALAIASRAIARAGTGHAYWRKFDQPNRQYVEEFGAAVNKLLFTPPLQLPIKTLEVPLAGFGYGASVLPFCFDLITLANNLHIPDSSTKRKGLIDELPEDPNGSETIDYLKSAKRSVEFLLSTEPQSLGLHPALYFYTSAGAFQPAALFNVLSWLTQLDENGEIVRFLKVRSKFEQMIMEHPVLGKPATHRLGSGGRTRRRMMLLYDKMLNVLSAGTSPDKAWTLIIDESEFSFLASEDSEHKERRGTGKAGARFSRAAKSGGFIESALPTAHRCELCGGLLHSNAIVTDHADERSTGGSSAGANGRPVHPRCNSERDHL
ncbi:DUF262 domain-containing protein [Mesorhizobium sp. B2-4-12]|uniref:GmrSD restriction endonuclease domain-containing protein n=1 Tax=Mesorhizobium sp. B2-4-12 TaxID=2589937 RepID=UPI00112B9E1E|nr:DUF262 domain-containing protein [Mesorhizobium sp. B2-4-12]TPK97232.1 DUF262 domain-containing protein [Mesorhizobium sp. B2-4-12]